MIRLRKVQAVASYEFLSTVKRKGYVILTFGMPLILAAYIGLISMIGKTVEKQEREPKLYGVVDLADVLRLTGETAAPIPKLPPEAEALVRITGGMEKANEQLSLAQGNAVFKPFATLEEARPLLDKEELKGIFVIPADYKTTGKIQSYVLERTMKPFGSNTSRQLGNMLLQRMITDRVPADIAERVRQPIAETDDWKISPSGELKPVGQFEEVAKFLVPLAFGMLFMFSILFTGGALLTAVATEKENKVIDVLLSSAYPDEILFGKLLGQGGAGLLQVAVWFGMFGLAGLLGASALAQWGVSVPWVAILVSPFYFVFGYLLLGSLLIGVGSLGNNQREAQQLTWIFNMLPAVPFFFLVLLLRQPNGTTAQVLSWIPFTSGQTMLIRLAAAPTGVSWWEILGTLVVVAVTMWGCIKLGGRLFRVGLLMTGARPSFKEVLRQAGFMKPAAARNE
jgi:ABC-2 type transport system permease protein